MQKALKQKELELNEMKSNYENSLIECQNLAKMNLNQKQQYEFELIQLQKNVIIHQPTLILFHFLIICIFLLHEKNESNKDLLEHESQLLRKQTRLFESIIKKLFNSYNEQKKQLESLVTLYK